MIRHANFGDLIPLSTMLMLEVHTLEDRLVRAEKYSTYALLVVLEPSHHNIIGAGYLRPWMRSAEISDVMTHANYRRQGVALALMHILIDTARLQGYHTVQLTCETNNMPALVLYRKLGFEPIRILTSPDKTLWVMSLTL